MVALVKNGHKDLFGVPAIQGELLTPSLLLSLIDHRLASEGITVDDSMIVAFTALLGHRRLKYPRWCCFGRRQRRRHLLPNHNRQLVAIDRC